MGRQASDSFMLPDGERVGFSLKLRGDTWQVSFPHPEDPERYVRASTGCTSKNDAYTEAAKLILKTYRPEKREAVKSATWEGVLADLARHEQLRTRSFDVYESAVRNLRQYVTTAGPGDITPERANEFRRQFANGTYSKSSAPGAKQYPRGAKTVENAIRRLSGLFGKLVKLGYVPSNPFANVERPKVPKKVVRIPTEEHVSTFLRWVEKTYPGWVMLRTFLEVKMLAGCRLLDLCSVKSANLDVTAGTLTITPDTDKTHRERVIPLPPDVVKTLDTIKGKTWLFESYTATAKTYRPGKRNKDEFSPGTLYWAVLDVFERYNKAHPDRPVKSHDFRRRAITLTVLASGVNVDEVAQAIGIDPSTARKHYLDAKTAFDGKKLLTRMADVLRQKPGQ